jgi:hypothetical protein
MENILDFYKDLHRAKGTVDIDNSELFFEQDNIQQLDGEMKNAGEEPISNK